MRSFPVFLSFIFINSALAVDCSTVKKLEITEADPTTNPMVYTEIRRECTRQNFGTHSAPQWREYISYELRTGFEIHYRQGSKFKRDWTRIRKWEAESLTGPIKLTLDRDVKSSEENSTNRSELSEETNEDYLFMSSLGTTITNTRSRVESALRDNDYIYNHHAGERIYDYPGISRERHTAVFEEYGNRFHPTRKYNASETTTKYRNLSLGRPETENYRVGAWANILIQGQGVGVDFSNENASPNKYSGGAASYGEGGDRYSYTISPHPQRIITEEDENPCDPWDSINASTVQTMNHIYDGLGILVNYSGHSCPL